MHPAANLFWKQNPFIRPLAMLATGIIVQWYIQPGRQAVFLPAILVVIMLAAGRSLYASRPAAATRLRGMAMMLWPFGLGMLLVFINDMRNRPLWAGQFTANAVSVTAVVDEPLSEKTNTWKARARIVSICGTDSCCTVAGNCVIYIKKDSIKPQLEYGSVLVFAKPLQAVQNNGNPGAFDYRRNSLFKGITHQVFLGANEYRMLPGNKGGWFQKRLFAIRDGLLGSLRRHIKDPAALGVAEALLIGYRDDLDKTLTEAYAGTGTIHVIAISGLHLGMIYWMLLWLLKPFENRPSGRWLRPLVVLAVLWLFTLLAGAAPSILRSAIMFSCMMLGQSMGRATSIYNSLAASAFIILCINPFSLWDAGFQLSYAAVLSIIVFMQPVYGLLYVKNKWLDALWKLNAVTISAQILTLPVILFHFHQFPNLFLLTNMVAVPLSSVILGGELVLLVLSWLPPVASVAGVLIAWLIQLMNGFVQWCGALPYSVTDYLQMNMAECWCLFAVIICTATWLLAGRKRAFSLALTALLVFGSLRLYAHVQRRQQQLLVVYNVPQRQAVDFIEGGRYYFLGDSVMQQNGFLKNFHLKPSRIEFGIRPGHLSGMVMQPPLYRLGHKTILVPPESGYAAAAGGTKLLADIIILSKNTRVSLSRLLQTCTAKQVVADASNRPYKVEQWEKICDSLQIPFHHVATDGAFVMNCR